MEDWKTTEQIKTEWNKQNFEIYSAIKKRELHAYSQEFRALQYYQIFVDRAEAERQNELVVEGVKKEITKSKTGYAPRILYLGLCDCIFKNEEVVGLWGTSQRQETIAESLFTSCNALAGSDLFTTAVQATIGLFLYCVEKTPVKVTKQSAFTFIEKNHPEIKESVSEIIWKSIPKGYKQTGRPKKHFTENT